MHTHHAVRNEDAQLSLVYLIENKILKVGLVLKLVFNLTNSENLSSSNLVVTD